MWWSVPKGVTEFGTWRELTNNVNQLAGNLTDQVRNIADVTTAVANLDHRIVVDKPKPDPRGNCVQ